MPEGWYLAFVVPARGQEWADEGGLSFLFCAVKVRAVEVCSSQHTPPQQSVWGILGIGTGCRRDHCVLNSYSAFISL